MPCSTNRYDVYWKHKPGTLFESEARRAGNEWKQLDNSRGVVLATPLNEGAAFCILGDAGGFHPETTRIKEHTFTDTGGIGWGSKSWDHWPIGWLNSQANEVNADSLKKFPNHFSPAGMDLFALPNEQVEQKDFYSLIGIGGKDLEAVQKVGRAWLTEKKIESLDAAAHLPPTAIAR